MSERPSCCGTFPVPYASSTSPFTPARSAPVTSRGIEPGKDAHREHARLDAIVERRERRRFAHVVGDPTSIPSSTSGVAVRRVERVERPRVALRRAHAAQSTRRERRRTPPARRASRRARRRRGSRARRCAPRRAAAASPSARPASAAVRARARARSPCTPSCRSRARRRCRRSCATAPCTSRASATQSLGLHVARVHVEELPRLDRRDAPEAGHLGEEIALVASSSESSDGVRPLADAFSRIMSVPPVRRKSSRFNVSSEDPSVDLDGVARL